MNASIASLMKKKMRIDECKWVGDGVMCGVGVGGRKERHSTMV